ncbi:HupE/UreJ family protein [Minwuia sp.]|uniref:HupE/UreJ family protein n=1 Tax=Minwuia sp. TaxID=2493630 RepID=UPI003A8DF7E6
MRHRWFAVAAATALPGSAHAHSAIEGIDAFYGGLLHPYVVPEHLLSLIALGLLVGTMGWRQYRIGIPAFLMALLAGLGLGAAGVLPVFPQQVLLVLAMICGAGAALTLPTKALLLAVPGVIVGAVIGLDSVPEDFAETQAWSVLGATAVGAGIVPAYLGALLIRFRREWLRLATRIAGSWVVAASLLVLSLVVFR